MMPGEHRPISGVLNPSSFQYLDELSAKYCQTSDGVWFYPGVAVVSPEAT